MGNQFSSKPKSPPGVSVEENVREAKEYAESHTLPETYWWFYQHVRNSGPWDYKQRGAEYADFGNYNYGATGTAMGIPENVLHRGAGAAQLKAGTSDSDQWGYFWQGEPYGDDPDDQEQIRNGIRDANDAGYKRAVLPMPVQEGFPPDWEGLNGVQSNGSVDVQLNCGQSSNDEIQLSSLVKGRIETEQGNVMEAFEKQSRREPETGGFDFHKALAEHMALNDEIHAQLDAQRAPQEQDQGLSVGRA